jgi:hypothetical protein
MQLDATGQVEPLQEGSQIKGNLSLAQDVWVIAVELSVLLEALKARQRSCDAFADGFKNDLMRLGIISCVVFWAEHHEYTPCTSQLAPSFEAEVMNVDSLKSNRNCTTNDIRNTEFFFNYIPAGISLKRQRSSANDSIARRLIFMEEQIDAA